MRKRLIEMVQNRGLRRVSKIRAMGVMVGRVCVCVCVCVWGWGGGVMGEGGYVKAFLPFPLCLCAN